MLLAKSCKKNHHIAKGTLRLGSLYEYRHTEIKHIADHEEGVMRFNIRLKGPIRISNKWSNTLFGGNFVFGSGDYYKFPGSTYAKVEVLRQNHTTNSYTEFGDTSLTITREALNSFIFCMSAVSTEEEATGIFPEYDSHWYITEQKIEAFGPAIAMSLGDAIILGRSTGKHIIPEHIDLKTLTIQTEGGKVFYKDRVINISNNSNLHLQNFTER